MVLISICSLALAESEFLELLYGPSECLRKGPESEWFEQLERMPCLFHADDEHTNFLGVTLGEQYIALPLHEHHLIDWTDPSPAFSGRPPGTLFSREIRYKSLPERQCTCHTYCKNEHAIRLLQRLHAHVFLV